MEQNTSQSNPSQQEDKQKCENKKLKDFKLLPIQEKIDKIVLKISLQTAKTQQASLLEQIFNELHLLFEDLKNFKTVISDDQAKTLFLKYHSFIKQSNKDTLSLKDSLNPTPEKMVEIKNQILEMIGNIKNLHNQALMASKKHSLWMDAKQSNNSLELQQLKNDYKDEIIVKYYTDNKKFREDVIELRGFPTLIILSASAAGSNIQDGDGDHFQFLKQNKKDLRLRGVVIYCGQSGFDNLQGLLKDEQRLLRCITSDKAKMMDAVKNLVVPLDFKRVIPFAELNAYLSASAISNLISFSQNDWSSRSLVDQYPKEGYYKDILNLAKDLIASKGIRMWPELVLKMGNISDEIEKLFKQTQLNNEVLSKSLMKLYSSESSEIPIYSVLNSILNIANEDLINVTQPFIDLFLIALYYYDDSSDTIIKRPIMNSVPIVYDFYRGSTIPIDQFNNDLIKVDNIITLPSFSSFSTDKTIAASFILPNQGFVDSQPVIFNYKYNTENQNFNNRPKFLGKVSPFKEKEYLVYPFTRFRITEVFLPAEGKEHYDIVLKLYNIN